MAGCGNYTDSDSIIVCELLEPFQFLEPYVGGGVILVALFSYFTLMSIFILATAIVPTALVLGVFWVMSIGCRAMLTWANQFEFQVLPNETKRKRAGSFG